MRIYLDDVRTAPEGFITCRTAQDTIQLIDTGLVDLISFDHDLGTEQTGYDVALYIEELVYHKKIDMPDWFVHSANPVGRKRIEQAMRSAERFIK